MRGRSRSFWTKAAAWLGGVAAAWAVVLSAGGGLDTHVLGVKIRARDPYNPLIFAVIGFVAYAWLRRPRSGTRASATEVRARLFSAAPIAAILVVGAVARFWGLAFGLPHPNTRPDEGAVASIAGNFYYGHWNPGSFNYPPLFMLAISAVMRFVLPTWRRLLADFRIRPWMPIESTTWRYMVARVLSAAAGVASIWVLFQAAVRLFDRRTALVAALFLALAFLHVRDSHFGVTDVPMTFMLVVAFFFVLKMDDSGTARSVLIAGAAAGLATATKYSAIFVALPAAFALIADRSGRPMPERLRRLGMYLGAMSLAFLVVCPFALLDSQKFLGDVFFEARHLAEGHGTDLGPGWLYHATTTLRYGLGLPLLVCGVAGLLLLIVRQPRKGVLVALYPVAFYLAAGRGRTVFFRYMLPMVPFLCLAAGYFVASAGEWLASALKRARLAPALVAVAAALVVWPSARSVWAFDRLISRTDSRLLARRWVEARFPVGTPIAQIGWTGGHPFLNDDNEVPYGLVELAPGNLLPKVVIVHSSPMTSPENLGDLREVLRTRYALAYEVPAASDDPENVYDRQDEFYVPYAGFRSIERPGPNVRIYVRRD